MIGLLNSIFSASSTRFQQEYNNAVIFPKSLSNLGEEKKQHIEELIILGVLLSVVAHADENMSKEEESKIEEILLKSGKVTQDEAHLVISAAHESRENRPDIQGFTKEINEKPYQERLEVLELLFIVAFADKTLSQNEMEMLRKIAKLFWITHKDFTDIKVKVKNTMTDRK